MSKRRTVKGRIIRILDTRTVIINLGTNDGIGHDCVFRVVGGPEAVVDPVTDEELGSVNVVKTKVKAAQVYDRFAIATTRWHERVSTVVSALSAFSEPRMVDHGELRVHSAELQPWKGESEVPVRVGDVVEADIEIAADEEENAEAPKERAHGGGESCSETPGTPERGSETD